MDTIASRLEAIATSNKKLLGWPLLLGARTTRVSNGKNVFKAFGLEKHRALLFVPINSTLGIHDGALCGKVMCSTLRHVDLEGPVVPVQSYLLRRHCN